MTGKPRKTVWHVEPIPDNGSSNIIAHARGLVRSDVTNAANAADTEAADRGCVDLGSATREQIAGENAARDAWLKSRRGRRPRPYAEFMLAGPPPYADDDAWPADKELAWAKSTREWVAKRFPDSLIVVASLHRDETSPHVHVVISPRFVNPETGEAGWGWCKARNVAANTTLNERRKRRRATPMRTGRRGCGNAMIVLQDDCHEHIGKPHGLERGERGSKRKHRAVDQVKAAAGRVKALKLQLEVREREIEVRDEESLKRSARLDGRIAHYNRRVGELTAKLKARSEAHKKRVAELDERENRQKAEGERLAERKRRLDEHERAHGKVIEQLRALKRRDEAVERKARIAERTDLAAREMIDRLRVATRCVDEGLGSPRIEDAALWMDRAHQAVHGDERERASVGALFANPGAAPAAKRDRGKVVEFAGNDRSLRSLRSL